MTDDIAWMEEVSGLELMPNVPDSPGAMSSEEFRKSLFDIDEKDVVRLRDHLQTLGIPHAADDSAVEKRRSRASASVRAGHAGRCESIPFGVRRRRFPAVVPDPEALCDGRLPADKACRMTLAALRP
ncbi:hypothetical protein [Jannaschia seosinensis]|uniref:hypothetical protein n=1 Tax=Jannaschia seosinensis TaxID=313367 RepID=UPI000AAA974C|nr:hypothetical protein [Jannaschia seosinensis]